MTIRVKSETIAWDAIQGSTSYDILINGVKKSSTKTSLQAQFALADGDVVRIVAQPSGEWQEITFDYSVELEPTFIESPDNTVVTNTTDKITDANGHVWQITSTGKVSVDGVADAITSGVIELAYESKKVWQKNSSGMWWYKVKPSDTWLPSGGTSVSPVPGDVPPPPPPPPTTSTYKDVVGTVSSDLVLAKQHGITEVRIDIGFLTKTKVDAAGINVIPIACYNPWSDLRPAGTGDHYAPDTTARRIEWSNRQMTKIKGVFTIPPKVIEVWNEPWLNQFWNAGPNANDFLDLVRQFSKVCWATPGYENTIILVAADTGWGGWNTHLLAFDTDKLLTDPRFAPTAHTYCNNQAPTATPTRDYGFQRWRFTYEDWKAHGHPHPEVYITEFGWVSNTPGSSPIGSEGPAVTEQQQSDYTVQAYEIGHTSGMVAKMYSYMLSPNQPWSYNWLRPDNSEKPVMPAVRQLIATG